MTILWTIKKEKKSHHNKIPHNEMATKRYYHHAEGRNTPGSTWTLNGDEKLGARGLATFAALLFGLDHLSMSQKNLKQGLPCPTVEGW